MIVKILRYLLSIVAIPILVLVLLSRWYLFALLVLILIVWKEL